jgi:hypothetical protein
VGYRLAFNYLKAKRFVEAIDLPQDPKGNSGKGEDEHPAVEAAAAAV